MNKPITYHKYHSFTDINEDPEFKVSAVTQQYQIGVYMVLNGEHQLTTDPPSIAKLEKRLRKREAEKAIKDLKLEHPITVTLVDGLWQEILPDEA